MIYGELGRYSLEIDIKSRIISFWAKLLSGKELKLSKIIYNLCYNLAQNDIILLFMSISKEYLPSSPYIIYDGVEDFK
jgi:hypothetical protein